MLLWLSISLSLVASATAHFIAFANGMFCKGVRPSDYVVDICTNRGLSQGLSGNDQNSMDGVQPAYQLPKEEWWSKSTFRPL